MFALSPGLDPAALAKAFSSSGRLQITNFLEQGCAMQLYQELASSTQWRLTVNKGEEIHHFEHEDLRSWSADRLATLDRAVASGGRYGFQFRYDVIRTDDRAPAILVELLEFLSSAEVLDFMQTLTGATDISFADGHATRFGPGHFLTAHDDRSDTMGRRAAYVLNLTPKWRPDWGGLLLFHDKLGNIARGFTPGFNVLNIFAVPQPHHVSWVTSLAAVPRYAVTGWLRAGSRPERESVASA
jgi:Rps23 Pro-64 3,4-dihydroxylase Tpa1-like proline 4-hydroxylase